MSNTKEQVAKFLEEIGFSGVKGIKEVGTSLSGKFAHIDEVKLHNQRFEQSPHSPVSNPSYFIGLAGELELDMAKKTFLFMGWKTAPLTTKGVATDARVTPKLPWELPHNHDANVMNTKTITKSNDDDLRAKNNADLSHYGEDYSHEHLILPIPKGMYESLREFSAAPDNKPATTKKMLILMRDLWLVINRKKFAGRMRSPKFQLLSTTLTAHKLREDAHGVWYPTQRIFSLPLSTFAAPINNLLETMMHESAHQYCSEVLKLTYEGHGANWQKVMHQIGLDIIPVAANSNDVYLPDARLVKETGIPTPLKLTKELKAMGFVHKVKYGQPIVLAVQGTVTVGRVLDVGYKDILDNLDEDGELASQGYTAANVAYLKMVIIKRGKPSYCYASNMKAHYVTDPEILAYIEEQIPDSSLDTYKRAYRDKHLDGVYTMTDNLSVKGKVYDVSDIVNKLSRQHEFADLGERGLQHPKDFLVTDTVGFYGA